MGVGMADVDLDELARREPREHELTSGGVVEFVALRPLERDWLVQEIRDLRALHEDAEQRNRHTLERFKAVRAERDEARETIQRIKTLLTHPHVHVNGARKAAREALTGVDADKEDRPANGPAPNWGYDDTTKES